MRPEDDCIGAVDRMEPCGLREDASSQIYDFPASRCPVGRRAEEDANAGCRPQVSPHVRLTTAPLVEYACAARDPYAILLSPAAE